MLDARRVRAQAELVRERAGEGGLRALADAAAAKGRRLRGLLGAEVSAEAVAAALPHVFPAARALRRHRQRLAPALTPAVARLLREEGPGAERVAAFAASTRALLGEAAPEVAADLLHFTDPQGHWLYARWVWNPADGTGVLAVLGYAPPAGAPPEPAAAYRQVGAALAEVAALLEPGAAPPGPHGLDAFLALAYAVHAHLVASVRTTDEFASILPPPLELATRLLGGPAARAAVATTGEGGRT